MEPHDHEEQISALYKISKAITSEMYLEDILRLIVAVTAQVMGSKICSIMLVDEKTQTLPIKATQCMSEEYLKKSPLRIGEGVSGRVVTANAPATIADVRKEPDYKYRDIAKKEGVVSMLSVPMCVKGRVIGVLNTYTPEKHDFTLSEIEVLQSIANQAAIAIENARLQSQEAERARLGRELELGHDIQRSLLPMEAPQLPGYQIAYRWRSAREVGGDFFDFVPLAPGRLGLVIADVSDKGVPAALYMMFARTLMRAAALSGREPAAALLRTNELILADSKSDMFITVYYSVLDAGQHKLTYASAGHNLALYAPADGGAPQPMVTEGIALGIIEEAAIGQKELDMMPGDVALFFTDGVVEALNPTGEEFGTERLADILCAQRGASAEAIADAIEAAVRAFAGDVAQYDDFTLILVKRSLDVDHGAGIGD